MANMSKAKAKTLLAHSERFLYATYGAETVYQINGAGVVPRRVAETMTAFLPGFEPDLIPQEDGLFPGFSQTWRSR